MATIPEISTAVTLNGNGHAAHDHDAAQEWADRVTCAIKSSVGSSIAIGETLIAAKEALAHGQW